MDGRKQVNLYFNDAHIYMCIGVNVYSTKLILLQLCYMLPKNQDDGSYSAMLREGTAHGVSG